MTVALIPELAGAILLPELDVLVYRTPEPRWLKSAAYTATHWILRSPKDGSYWRFAIGSEALEGKPEWHVHADSGRRLRELATQLGEEVDDHG